VWIYGRPRRRTYLSELLVVWHANRMKVKTFLQLDDGACTLALAGDGTCEVERQVRASRFGR